MKKLKKFNIDLKNGKNKKKVKKTHPPTIFTCEQMRAELLSQFNDELTASKERIHELKLCSFGSGLYAGDDNSCLFLKREEIVASTIADRFSGKFERPVRSTADALRAKAVDDWVSFESGHLKGWKFHSLGHRERGYIYRARDRIDLWLFPTDPNKNNFWHYVNNALDQPLNFGPGESFNARQGDVSFFSKLNNVKDWTVTVDAAPAAAKFIANCKAFRVVASKHLLKRGLRGCSFSRITTGSSLRLSRDSRSSRLDGLPPEEFSQIVLNRIFYEHDILDDRCLVKLGSRGTSVYKDTKKRRFINIECFLNVVMQMVFATGFRLCLKHNANNDLELGQDRHRQMIKDPTVSTVDESNASDSIHHTLTRLMLKNKRVFSTLNSLRSEFILLNEKVVTANARFSHVKNWHPVVKTSSMGNGFTFELLTLTLLALVREFDPQGSVYGDDIICKSNNANDVVHSITAAGFIVNEKKSFLGKPLRESCGRFFLDGYGDITCYDIKWCHNINDVILSVNKLGRIVRQNNISHPIIDILRASHARLLALIPAPLRGPITDGDQLPTWVEDRNYIRCHMTSKTSQRYWKKYSKPCDGLTTIWQLDHPDQEKVRWVVCMLPSPLLTIKIRKKYDNVRNMALAYTYINQRTVTDQIVRVPREELSWGFKPTLISSQGHQLRAATALGITCE